MIYKSYLQSEGDSVMKYVWRVKHYDWDEDNRQYKERFSGVYGGSLKARRAAIEYITIDKKAKGVETNERSKNFYTVTAQDGNAHCIIYRETVH